MGDFNRGSKFGGGRDKKFGGRDGGGRSFGGRSGGGFRDRDGDRPSMHQATCSGCGNSCEVPFKPTGEKPVYCNDCFRSKNGSEPRRSEGRSFERKDFGRSSFGEEKKMYTTICSKCGTSCEVPFKPNGEKPVYCSSCFGKTDSAPSGRNFNGSSSSAGISKEQFETLNSKLDKIMKSLGLVVAVEPVQKKEIIKEVAKVVKEVKEVKEIKGAKAVKEVKALKPAKVAKKTEKKAVEVKKPAAKKVIKKKKA